MEKKTATRSIKRQVNGILVLDKPMGLSSNQALQRVKWLFKAKKAGHTGSLDPLATGVLPICFGKSTKLSGSLLEADKKYLTTVKLGTITTTGDAEGEVVSSTNMAEFAFNNQEIKDIINSFIGIQEQVPSMYSALKHNGVPLYKLARQGIIIPRQARSINIYNIEILNFNSVDYTIELLIHCSKGTYIRTLIEDIGEKIGCGAFVASLRRVSAGPYDINQTVKISQLEQIEQRVNENDYSLIDQLLL
jgi:tRNA pseudouridine55 synthase